MGSYHAQHMRCKSRACERNHRSHVTRHTSHVTRHTWPNGSQPAWAALVRIRRHLVPAAHGRWAHGAAAAAARTHDVMTSARFDDRDTTDFQDTETHVVSRKDEAPQHHGHHRHRERHL